MGDRRSLTTMQYLKTWVSLLVNIGWYFDTMAEWEKLTLSEAKYPTGEDPLKVLCEIIAVSDMRGGKGETFAEYKRWREKFDGPKMLSNTKAFGLHRLGKVYALLLALAGMRALRRNLDGIFVGKIRHIFMRRLARTKGGFLALVPELSRRGDRIALFKGGKMPFLVREQGRRWELIGCSYVHGIMFGEAWNEGRCKEMEII